MIIRQATLRDIPNIRRLNAEVQDIHIQRFPDIFKKTSPQEIDEWLKGQIEADYNYVIVASDIDEIIGYAILKLVSRAPNPFTHARKFAYIEHACVTESRRHLGIGKSLIKNAVKYAESQDYKRVELDVWTDNKAAKKSFEKLGFSTYCEKKVLQQSA